MCSWSLAVTSAKATELFEATSLHVDHVVLDDAPNAGLPMSPSQAEAEDRSLQTAEVARRLGMAECDP